MLFNQRNEIFPLTQTIEHLKIIFSTMSITGITTFTSHFIHTKNRTTLTFLEIHESEAQE